MHKLYEYTLLFLKRKHNEQYEITVSPQVTYKLSPVLCKVYAIVSRSVWQVRVAPICWRLRIIPNCVESFVVSPAAIRNACVIPSKSGCSYRDPALGEYEKVCEISTLYSDTHEDGYLVD
jgi:hypothetical protein